MSFDFKKFIWSPKANKYRYKTVSLDEEDSQFYIEPLDIEEDIPAYVPSSERGPPDDRPRLSNFNMICLTISFLGIQFGWALQIGLTTPIFLSLGISAEAVSYAWLAGPISGLVVQPIVGVLSDRTTHKWGRRRPYILWGAVAVVIGQMLISNAGSASVLFGFPDHRNGLSITIAIIGFWIMDLANNAVQGPCRALLVDIAPADQQNWGGSLFSFMLGLGNLTGYALAGVDMINVFPFMGSNQRIIFLMASITLIICISITVYYTPERRITKEEMGPMVNPFKKIFEAIGVMPASLRRVCAVQFFTWIAWFTVFLYGTAWVGEAIYGGSPEAPEDSEEYRKFDHGVQFGSLALCVNSAITMVASVGLPYAVSKVGIKPVYSFGQFMLAVCLIPMFFVHTRAGAFILLAGLGIPWSVVMVLPFTLVALCVEESQCGLYIGEEGVEVELTRAGVLNIFVVIPQLVVALLIGQVITIAHGNMAVAFLIGASALCWALIVPRGKNINLRAGSSH
ncbi:hypothetical protein PROFUN_12162 [Planoprotostelium fungivorum]|uniref:Uncharacterized protein n=1 Tax=Planoprotostelium fungivorum TaxID=1890364 RepID=A0A2P6N8C4_9EUKA|nr:hypothetical protein PROFUN_12162 [Planoprotostelium fungivorum]